MEKKNYGGNVPRQKNERVSRICGVVFGVLTDVTNNDRRCGLTTCWVPLPHSLIKVATSVSPSHQKSPIQPSKSKGNILHGRPSGMYLR